MALPTVSPAARIWLSIPVHALDRPALLTVGPELYSIPRIPSPSDIDAIARALGDRGLANRLVDAQFLARHRIEG